MTSVEFELAYANTHTRIKPHVFMELVQQTLNLSGREASQLVVTQEPMKIRATAEQFTRFLVARYNLGLQSGLHANGFCELKPRLLEERKQPTFWDVRER